VSLAEPSKQQRDTDRFTAKKVRVDLVWNFDFKGHPVRLDGGLGDDPAPRSSSRIPQEANDLVDEPSPSPRSLSRRPRAISTASYR
jgi:hypothetical protein